MYAKQILADQLQQKVCITPLQRFASEMLVMMHWLYLASSTA